MTTTPVMLIFYISVLLLCTLSLTVADNDGVPTVKPTWKPTLDPTWEPTPAPTPEFAPSRYPTRTPTPRPSPQPTPFPTLHGGVHSSREPTPSPSMGMASFAMHYELFGQEVTLADMMAIAVTIWGAIFVFALRYHYTSSGTTDKLSAIRLDDISAHSEMDTSNTPALRASLSTDPPLAAPFALKKNNIFNLRGSSSSGSNKEVVAAAVASALHMPTSNPIPNSFNVAVNNTDMELHIPENKEEKEEEEDLRM